MVFGKRCKTGHKFAKFGANPSTGGFCTNGLNITKFYLFINFYLFSGTHVQVRPVDRFLRLMARRTCTCATVCLLGISLILCSIQILQFAV